MAQYFGSKPVFDWNPNGSAESGHDFIDQINEQKGKISGKETQYQDYQANVNNAQQTYEDAYKNQQAYGDLYNQAKQSEGVDTAREQYQKSLNAVNATNTAMTNLPSTINAGSNVVLNASQRNAALGNQMNKYANTLGYWTNQNAADQKQYQDALGAAQSLASQQMGQEQAKVAQSMTNYQAQMNYANELYNQLLSERNILRTIYGKMYDDEYNHRMQEIQIWADNLQAETARYQEQQANYRAQLAKQMSDYEKYLVQQEEAKKVSRPDNAITSGGEWTVGGQSGTVSPIKDTVNGTARYTYVAPTYIAPDGTVYNTQNSRSTAANGNRSSW